MPDGRKYNPAGMEVDAPAKEKQESDVYLPY